MNPKAKLWISAAVAVVVLLMAYAAQQSLRSGARPPSVPGQPGPTAQAALPAPPGTIAITIASSNTKQEWLHAAVRAFNEASGTQKALQVDAQPIHVQILQETVDGKPVDYRSGTMVSDTLHGKIKPTVISPGEESWLLKFKGDWKVAHNTDAIRGEAPILVRTPLVIAMWQSRAKAMGCIPESGPNCKWERVRALAAHPEGWKMFGRPEWGRFTLGYGYFGESNSGTLAVTAMCTVGAKKTRGLAIADVNATSGCGRFVAEVERAKFHSGKSDLWLLEQMIGGGPDYLDAVVTYESNVILMNQKHGQSLREPLVAVYPQDGTVVVGHPFAILDGTPWVTPQQATAAKAFGTFLLSKEQQEAVMRVGLRPADPAIKLAAPIDASAGANPEAKFATLEVPETRVIEQLGEVWRRVKKHAAIVLLFDKSGSMSEGGKIGAAVRGAQEFVRQMEGEDLLTWMPFDSTIYLNGASGTKSQIGEDLVQQIAGTRAQGGTKLYDAMLTAVDNLSRQRATHRDTVRYGIVLLSDGRDEGSVNTLSTLVERLRPQESDPTGIQIHAIAIGSDADETVLRRIAGAAHGRFWKGQSEKDMVRIYKEIATYW